jgi:hypothetical protein
VSFPCGRFVSAPDFPSCRNLEAVCEKFLGIGEGKVSDELISLKAYASSLAAREPGDPKILYDPDYTSLAFRGQKLTLHRMQTGLNELVNKTWNALLDLSGGTKIEVTVPPSVCEDLRSSGVGDSFMKHITTEPPSLPLLFEMSRNPGISLLRPTWQAGAGTRFEVDPSAAQEFFHTIKPIVEAIAFLIHATGSGPLRMSEVVEDRYCNGSSPRNLFMSHGLLFLLRRNLKSSSLRGHRSSVIHFPPGKIAELLIYYLAVIRPVEVFLAAALKWTDQQAAYSQFIYVVKGRRLTPQGLSWIIAECTERYFGCRLTGLDFRHVLISIQSVFLPPIVDPSVQKFGDSQAGHSSRTANQVYGQRLDHLPGEQAALFVLSYHWCRKLHTVLGLGPESVFIPPIPYIHAPSAPTWWSPANYIPPHPTSSQELLSQFRLLMNTQFSSVAHELSTRCETILREFVSQASVASSLARNSKRPVPERAPSVAPEAFRVLPLTPDSVSSSTERILYLSSLTPRSQCPKLTSTIQFSLLLELGGTTNSTTSYPSTPDRSTPPSPATLNGSCSTKSSLAGTTTSSQSCLPGRGSQSLCLDRLLPRAGESPSLSPATPPSVARLPSKHAHSESSTLCGATEIWRAAQILPRCGW